jgi:hypothetical protein
VLERALPTPVDQVDEPPVPVRPPGRREQLAELARRGYRRARRGATVIIWLALALYLSAAPSSTVPTPGNADTSWAAGMNFAAIDHLRFGPDLLFTFGPYGFLDVPEAVDPVRDALGFVFGLVAATAVFVAGYAILRRTWSPRSAAPGAFLTTVVLAAASSGEKLVCAGIVAAILVLQRRRRGTISNRWSLAAVVLFGASAALLVQVKFSEGVAMVALSAILAAFSPPSWRGLARSALVTVAAFAVTFLAFWFAAGQRLADLLPWLRGSQEIATGYQEGLAIEMRPVVLGYLAAAGLALIAGAAAYWILRTHRSLPAVGVLVLAVVVVEFAFKDGFTRHDSGHEVSYFVLAGFLLLGLSGWLARPRICLVAAAASLLMVITGVAVLDPAAARERWRTGIEALFDPAYQQQRLDDARGVIDERYQVSPTTLAAVRGHPVHVDPWDTVVAWAYSLNWKPVPVFQAYAAYTPYLDGVNASALLNAAPDQTVLRRDQAPLVDPHNALWESPQYELALACDYTVVASDGQWSALRHSGYRCDAPRTVQRLQVTAGQLVTVPAADPDEIVVMRFTPDPPGLFARAVDAVVKDWSPIHITTVNGTYRVPKALADGPLMMSLPSSMGWEGEYGAAHYRWFTVDHPGTVEFETVAVLAG